MPKTSTDRLADHLFPMDAGIRLARKPRVSSVSTPVV